MKRNAVVGAVVVMLLSGSAWAQSRSNASRVDFDDQLVQGQVNKGAVHLIERKDSDLGSLVKKRTSYRKEILAGTAIAEAKPAVAVAALPVALPVVKLEAPAPAPAAAPAVKAVPAAKKSVKPATKKGPAAAKKPAAKQSKSNGGSRVLSRR